METSSLAKASQSPNKNKSGEHETRRAQGGRGGPGPGGGGRGRALNQGGTRTPQTETSSLNNITIMTEDFKSFVDKCSAKHYKVYSDKCSHSKLVSLQNSSLLDMEGSTPGSGYIVIPNTNKLKWIFHRNSKSLSSPNNNIKEGTRTRNDDFLERERQLRDVLFVPSLQPFQFKVSCANCILETQPNGFVCIVSSSSVQVDRARDLARRQAQVVKERGEELHSDHTDHVCTLPEQLLRAALPPWKKGKKNEAMEMTQSQSIATLGILQCMADQGLPIKGGGGTAGHGNKIKFGHHLKSILKILGRQQGPKDIANDGGDKYIFTMIREIKKSNLDNEETVLDIDLPGGKRHLGETSFECAVRETMEETSLRIDSSWLVTHDDKANDKDETGGSEVKADAWNMFFFSRPPPLDSNTPASNMSMSDDVNEVISSMNNLKTS